MVAALKAMPVVKAPRSFVLPREMAKQPKRSIFAWYPTLRLATALAAIAFVVLFAGDLLISRSGQWGGRIVVGSHGRSRSTARTSDHRYEGRRAHCGGAGCSD